MLDVSDGDVATNYDALVQAVRGGDILMSRGWFPDPYNAAVLSIYQQAACPPAAPPVVINDGAAQRSKVTALTIQFAEPVVISANGVTISNSRGNPVPGVALALTNPSGDQRTYVAAFSGSAIVVGSLPDGTYCLTVTGNLVHNLFGNAMVATQKTKFHRLFGDINGDRALSRAELTAMRASVDQSGNYVWYLDYDGNGRLDLFDYRTFRSRLLRRLL